MVAEAQGLAQALGLAGIALDEGGGPVIQDAVTPPNTRPAMPDVALQPSAPDQTSTTIDGSDERMTLDEQAAVLLGEAGPDQNTTAQDGEQPALADAPTTDGPPLTPRELELQQRLDALEADRVERELQDAVDARQDVYDEKWNEGQHFWEVTVPERINRAARAQGATPEVAAQAMLMAAAHHRQWNETLLKAERDDPYLRKESYPRTDPTDALIAEYGLSPEDKPTLAKYKANPDIQRDLAASLGARVQAQAQRQTQARQAAGAQVAQHLSQGPSPSAPNVAPGKLPYKFQGGDRNHEEASMFSQLLRGGKLGARD